MRILILGVNLNGGVGTLRAHLVMGNSDEMILGGRGRRERGKRENVAFSQSNDSLTINGNGLQHINI